MDAKAMAAFKDDEDPNMAAAAVELAAAAAAAVREGTHLLEKGVVGYKMWQQGAAEVRQRDGRGSEGTGSKIAYSSTQRSIEVGSDSDVGSEREAGGQDGRQTREVRGRDGAAMCT